MGRLAHLEAAFCVSYLCHKKGRQDDDDVHGRRAANRRDAAARHGAPGARQRASPGFPQASQASPLSLSSRSAFLSSEMPWVVGGRIMSFLLVVAICVAARKVEGLLGSMDCSTRTQLISLFGESNSTVVCSLNFRVAKERNLIWRSLILQIRCKFRDHGGASAVACKLAVKVTKS